MLVARLFLQLGYFFFSDAAANQYSLIAQMLCMRFLFISLYALHFMWRTELKWSMRLWTFSNGHSFHLNFHWKWMHNLICWSWQLLRFIHARKCVHHSFCCRAHVRQVFRDLFICRIALETLLCMLTMKWCEFAGARGGCAVIVGLSGQSTSQNKLCFTSFELDKQLDGEIKQRICRRR